MTISRQAEERRIHRRIKSSIGADVNKNGLTSYTHLRNISRGGAYIHSFTDNDYRVGQDIIVALPSKKKGKIRLVSRIVRVDNDGIGVKFLRYH